ncbi:MAG: zinc ribbon domain-containing protein [Acidobacteriota bacterium]|nr:zinc ribbon domain-containing protein [Acidobacteriota bacterium]
MAETLVENQVCNHCGADIRPASLFCYSCGSSIATETVVDLKDKESIGEARFRRILAEGKNGDKTVQIKQTIIEESVDKSVARSSVQTETELKSAAEIRRKYKTIQPKRIEIVWEEHSNAPNGWFILAAILLTLTAAGILYLAIYLK